MRQPAPKTIFFAYAFVLLMTDFAFSTPVYLKMESPFSTGNYSRQLLESRTNGVHFERWLRLETTDKAYGWIPEWALITAARLLSEAITREPVPVRNAPIMDSMERESFTKGTRVQIESWHGTWAKVSRKVGERLIQSWIPSESLLPAFDAATRYAMVFEDSDAFVLPGVHARKLDRIPAGTRLKIESERAGWLEVQTAFGKGFIPASSAATAQSLGETRARVLYESTPMRSAPLPFANLSRKLARGTVTKIIASENLRWGRAKLNDIGEVWWPIQSSVSESSSASVTIERLTARELFERSIFDMAASPAISTLKIASAQGVYRTLDGTEWTKIPLFADKNFPIAISQSGIIFVGPYLSEDHGETFEQWIRWDSLIAALKHYQRVSANQIRIENIKAEDPRGQRVVLKITVGNQIVHLRTSDQGMQWRRL